MRKRVFCLILLMILVLGILSSVHAHPEQSMHDKDLKSVNGINHAAWLSFWAFNPVPEQPRVISPSTSYLEEDGSKPE